MTTEAPPRPATPTERKVAEMLLENTGSHMLDSGGIYGRAWQRTRAKYGLNPSKNSSYSGGPLGPDPDPTEDQIAAIALVMRYEPEGEIDRWGVVTVDTFHWLTARLDYDPELDAKYQRFTRVHNFGKDRYDAEWGMAVVDAFVRLLWDEHEATSGGIYPGEGALDNIWTNTYNGEDALDRTLQFALFHVEEDGFLPWGSYVILQIHGGADVRGGYTDPVLFRVGGNEASDLFDNARVEVWCEGNTEDVVPDGQIDGQVTMDAEILTPQHIEHSHRWDNSYGDSYLRLTYSDGDWVDGNYNPAGVLVFVHEDEQPSDTVQIEYGYTNPEGKVIRPDRYAPANNATIENLTDSDDTVVGYIWHCPFDGSPLRASGAIVG